MSPHSDIPSPSGSYNPPSHLAHRPSHLRPNSIYSSSPDPYSTTSPSNTSTTSLSSSDSHTLTRPLLPGLYVPTLAFFHPQTEDLDLPTLTTHTIRLARAGITGLATQGSNGEAVHLTHSERRTVTQTVRSALNSSGHAHIPVLVGCGAQSVRETIQLCRDAFESGGDYALVLPPSYYAGLFKPDMESVKEFFRAVADASPLPLVIYNYPGAVGGLDLSSDVIVELARHANIVGVKLTCGNTGKLARIVAATKGVKKPAAADSNAAPPFLVLGGSADFTLQTLVVGGHGILAGLANIAPKTCLRLMELYRQGKIAEAQEVQEVLARGDWTAIKGGVVGTKAGMQGLVGYGGWGRSPLPKPGKGEAEKWVGGFGELWAMEKSL